MPGIESVTDGSVNVKVASKKYLVISLQVRIAVLFEKVKVVLAVAKLYPESAAFVIVRIHVPAVEEVKVVPTYEQPVAVPFVTAVIDNAPEPEPPVTLETDTV